MPTSVCVCVLVCVPFSTEGNEIAPKYTIVEGLQREAGVCVTSFVRAWWETFKLCHFRCSLSQGNMPAPGLWVVRQVVSRRNLSGLRGQFILVEVFETLFQILTNKKKQTNSSYCLMDFLTTSLATENHTKTFPTNFCLLDNWPHRAKNLTPLPPTQQNRNRSCR